MKKIRISWISQFPDYEDCFIVKLLSKIADGRIEFTDMGHCDLLIVGPYEKPMSRSLFSRIRRKLSEDFETGPRFKVPGRKTQPVLLYQSWENYPLNRFNEEIADFGITSDLGNPSPAHFRFPLWMALLDWSHDGIPVSRCPRLGDPMQVSRLMEPLGRKFLEKPREAAMISMHLREPRNSLMQAIGQAMPVVGYGAAFQDEVRHHNDSGFTKREVLAGHGFCLCPENSLFPGYYTEKIADAFSCDTLPISWCDENVAVDFNPRAFINMLPYAGEGYGEAAKRLLEPRELRKYPDEPLINYEPNLAAITVFLRGVLQVLM